MRQFNAVVVRQWRRSLYLRVITVTTFLGILGVGVVALVIGDQVSKQLFEAKTAQIQVDARQATTEFRRQLAAMDKTSATEVELFLRDEVQRLAGSGDGPGRSVLLLRNPNNDSQMRILEVAAAHNNADSQDLSAISFTSLRDQLRGSTGVFWQSVGIPSAGNPVPGIAVGQQVAVPIAGPHDLILVYDLSTEQQTLTSVQRVLAGGAAVLVVLISVVAWLVTRLVVSPIKSAATSANRLASGDLNERMPVMSDDDLGSLARSFNDMASTLQAQFEQMAELSLMQRRFVSDVSHELRTPLTTIRMAADLIHDANDDMDEVAARSTELLCNQLDRFEQLLADLLEISRFDAGAAQLDLDEVDLVNVVHTVADLMRPLAEANQAPLHIADDISSVTFQCDRLRVERILRNLLVNAIEHADQNPVNILLGSTDQVVTVAVQDHGVGLHTKDLQRVFDRFWRADPARARRIGGSGLGLSISREDARLHGGQLEVWGSPGVGATFRLTLPVRPGLAIKEAAVPLPDRGLALWWDETPTVAAPISGAALAAEGANPSAS